MQTVAEGWSCRTGHSIGAALGATPPERSCGFGNLVSSNWLDWPMRAQSSALQRVTVWAGGGSPDQRHMDLKQIGSVPREWPVLYFARKQSTSKVTQPLHRIPDRDAAFEREALPWIDDVYRFALSLTRDESDADDIVQETYLRAYKSWHTFLLGSDCRRWLFTICRNVFLRSRERSRVTVELDASDGADVVAVGAVFAQALERGWEDMFSRLDLMPAIERALRAVPEPFRSALILVDVEDQSYETAAEVLAVPIGTVRSRLFRGRRLMQEQLVAYARDAGLVATTQGHAPRANA